MGPTMPEAALVAETLTVAMAVAPGVYSRNRHFSLHQRPEARAARRRAALVRGIVRHLAVAVDVRVVGGGGGASDDERGGALEVSYRVAALAFERTARLSSAELACVRYLARKVGVTLPPALTEGATPETDAALVEATLARLSPAR